MECLFVSYCSIHPIPKEYGFGQSLLHEGQLVFHTPPYSIQNVTLQECYEYVSKVSEEYLRWGDHSVNKLFNDFQTNVKPSGKHGDNNSPILLPKYERSDMSPNSTLRTPGSERAVKIGNPIKERESPHTMDRRGRRYSYTTR